MIKNFRAYNIAVEFYRDIHGLKLSRHLQDKCQRASASIVLNLAEGSARATKADQCRFFTIAFGSLRECQAILDLIPLETELAEKADKLAAHLYKLIQHFKRS